MKLAGITFESWPRGCNCSQELSTGSVITVTSIIGPFHSIPSVAEGTFRDILFLLFLWI